MAIDSKPEELFAEPKGSSRLKLLGALLALTLTALVFVGYTYLRNKHSQDAAAKASRQAPSTEPKAPPQALILIDEALLQGRKTILGGTVKNTSAQPLGPLTIELELKRRNDGGAEKKLVALAPAQLEPQQEGRYSLELKTQEYGSARVTALKGDGASLPIPYTTAPGRKRALERIESKTITVDKRRAKGDEFLNSADNPARVP